MAAVNQVKVPLNTPEFKKTQMSYLRTRINIYLHIKTINIRYLKTRYLETNMSQSKLEKTAVKVTKYTYLSTIMRHLHFTYSEISIFCYSLTSLHFSNKYCSFTPLHLFDNKIQYNYKT